jgi:hypothetical protein
VRTIAKALTENDLSPKVFGHYPEFPRGRLRVDRIIWGTRDSAQDFPLQICPLLKRDDNSSWMPGALGNLMRTNDLR